MNRTIKFRVWDKAIKQFLIQDGSCFKSPSYIYSLGSIVNQDKECKNLVLQQFTGVLDENKKEIYEGDIVRFPMYSDNASELGLVNAEVIYDSDLGRFQVKPNYKEIPWNNLSEHHAIGELFEVELIGNIFETPELLK